MSRLVDINWNPSPTILRQFGPIALVGFSLMALGTWFGVLAFAYIPENARVPTAAAFVAIGVLCALFGWLWPSGNRPIFVGLSLLAAPIGFVLSYVILGLLFYVIIAGVSVLLRLVGKDPLERAFLPDAESYWVDARPARPAESYFKQF